MKFGLFFELSVPRPLTPAADRRMYETKRRHAHRMPPRCCVGDPSPPGGIRTSPRS